jgi:hypothetical protein
MHELFVRAYGREIGLEQAHFERNRLASEVLGRVCRDIASEEASGEVAAMRAAVVTAASTDLRGGEPIGGRPTPARRSRPPTSRTTVSATGHLLADCAKRRR